MEISQLIYRASQLTGADMIATLALNELTKICPVYLCRTHALPF